MLRNKSMLPLRSLAALQHCPSTAAGVERGLLLLLSWLPCVPCLSRLPTLRELEASSYCSRHVEAGLVCVTAKQRSRDGCQGLPVATWRQGDYTLKSAVY